MFGKRLNRLRKARGITAQRMAEQLNVELRSYRKYESGQREPSLETVVRLARILQVTTDDLLCDKQEPHSEE